MKPIGQARTCCEALGTGGPLFEPLPIHRMEGGEYVLIINDFWGRVLGSEAGLVAFTVPQAPKLTKQLNLYQCNQHRGHKPLLWMS